MTTRASGDLTFDDDHGPRRVGRPAPESGCPTACPPASSSTRGWVWVRTENYVDRRASAVVGRWTSTVDEQYVPYLMPQEHGARTGVRWCTLEAPGSGTGLLMVAGPGAEDLHATVGHHSAAQLWAARDWTELERTDDVVVHLDQAQPRVGHRFLRAGHTAALPRGPRHPSLQLAPAPLQHRGRGPRGARPPPARLRATDPRRSGRWKE